jgi:hypothetical protein
MERLGTFATMSADRRPAPPGRMAIAGRAARYGLGEPLFLAVPDGVAGPN